MTRSTQVLVIALVLIAAACGPSVSGGGQPDGAVADAGSADGATGTPDANGVSPDAPEGCAAEVCDNGFDDNCDGVIDDGCACSPGATQPCFSGPLSARGVGLCFDGITTCTGEKAGEFGMWGPCVGDQLPAAEVCDGLSLDENCDGAGNEGCDCTVGDPPAPCGSDVGVCVAGTQECVDGMLGPCVGSTGPGSESCNGLDDDCDGTVDEGLTMTCGSTEGACTAGTSTCTAGSWGPCEGAGGPSAETCNGIDDDCDGIADDGTAVMCGSDIGACVAGVSSCVGGVYGACTGEVGPAAELCNSLDDDCDGMTDEGLTSACGTDTGDCVSGTQTCSGGMWSTCAGSVGPVVEDCDGGDDDCDGMTDEGCTCMDGAVIGCGTDIGACVAGTQTCTGGAYGPCTGSIGPVAEICGNGIDDDCDGFIDELADCPILSAPIANCPGDITSVPLATVTLSGSGSDPDGGAVTYLWTVTVRPPGSTSLPATPTSSTTTFFLDLAGTYTLTLTVTDDEGATATCTVDIFAIPPQDLHVELVWDTAYGDADLHLIQAGVTPTGAWYTIEPDCFYGNTAGAWPPMGGAGNASLDIDDTSGYGPENINISNSPAAGNYEIGVAYYCSHGLATPGSPPPAPGDGPTTATVNIYCAGSLIATYPDIDLDRTGRFVDLATVTWPGCAGTSHYTNTWTALVQPAAYTSPLHCSLPCTNNADCGGGEVCGGAGTCVLD